MTLQDLYNSASNVGCGCPGNWCCKNDKCVDGAECLPFPKVDKSGSDINGNFKTGGICVLKPKKGQKCGKLNAPCCYKGDEGTPADGKCYEDTKKRIGYCEPASPLLNNGPGPKCKPGPRKLTSGPNCGKPKVGTCVGFSIQMLSVTAAAAADSCCICGTSRLGCASRRPHMGSLLMQEKQGNPPYYEYQPCCKGKKCPGDLVCRPTEEFSGHGNYARPAWLDKLSSTERLCYFCEARVNAKCGPQTENNVKCCADLMSFGPGFPHRVMHCAASDGSATKGDTKCHYCGYDNKVCLFISQLCTEHVPQSCQSNQKQS